MNWMKFFGVIIIAGLVVFSTALCPGIIEEVYAEPLQGVEENSENPGVDNKTGEIITAVSGDVSSVAADYVEEEKDKANIIIQTYQMHRLSFAHKQQKIDGLVQEEGRALDNKLSELTMKLEQLANAANGGVTLEELPLPVELSNKIEELDKKNTVNYGLLVKLRLIELIAFACLFPELLLAAMLFGGTAGLLAAGVAPLFAPFMIVGGAVGFPAILGLHPETQGMLTSFIEIGLPIIVVNIFAFLFFREKELFSRYKKSIIIGFIVLVASCIISSGRFTIIFVLLFYMLFFYGGCFLIRCKKEFLYRYKIIIIAGLTILMMAYATTLIAGQEEKRDKVEERLDYTVQLLGLSDYAKAIAMLEAKMNKSILLPENLLPGDPLLPLSVPVLVNTPGYFITLASLYTQKGDISRAIDVLSQLVTVKTTRKDIFQKSISNAVRFMVQHAHKNVAVNVLDSHLQQFSSVPSLLDLAMFIESHSMPITADKLLKSAMEKAVTSSDYLSLVQYFQQEEKQDKAESYLTKAWERAGSIDEIYQVLLLAKEINVLGNVGKVKEKIKKGAGDVSQFLTLATFFEKEGKSDLAALLLERSVGEATSEAELRQIVMVAIELNHDNFFEQIRNRVLKIMDKPMDGIGFVDYLLEHNRREDGVALFSAIAEKALQKSTNRTEHSLLVIQLAMKRKFLEEAAQWTIQLVVALKGDSFGVYVNSDYAFAGKDSLPDPDQISLPLFYGLINEELGLFSKAEQMYLSAVLHSLNIVVTSSGRDLPESLNEYTLLGRMWMKNGRVELLAKLDQALTILEANVLKQKLQKKKEEQLGKRLAKLENLQKELNDRELKIKEQQEIQQTQDKQYLLKLEERLKERIAEAEVEIISKQKYLSRITKKLYWSLPGTVVIILAIVLLLAGCVVLSWQHANKCSGQKTYAGLTRFIELNGWIRIFSILGIVSGFFLVCLGQLWQFPQNICENTRRGA